MERVGCVSGESQLQPRCHSPAEQATYLSACALSRVWHPRRKSGRLPGVSENTKRSAANQVWHPWPRIEVSDGQGLASHPGPPPGRLNPSQQNLAAQIAPNLKQRLPLTAPGRQTPLSSLVCHPQMQPIAFLGQGDGVPGPGLQSWVCATAEGQPAQVCMIGQS